MVTTSDHNFFLIAGSFFLAILYQILAFLGIQVLQVYTLFGMFCLSGIAGLVKQYVLDLPWGIYIKKDVVAKTLMMVLPFSIALAAKQINALYIFVDWAFSFLILGELLSVITSIQSVIKKQDIRDVDVYNLAIEKIKEVVLSRIKLDPETHQKNNQNQNKEQK